MADTSEDEKNDKEESSIEEASDEPKKKFSLKLNKPNPIIFFFIGPAICIFALYLVLSNILLPSDLMHEEKLEIVMVEEEEESIGSDGVPIEEGGESGEDTGEGGFLDTHNYFQFPVAFAVNIPDSKKHLTFELAVSTFQTGVGAEWFFESFTAFVPAIRSDILYFMGEQSLADLQSEAYQAELLNQLKSVINKKLESLGAKPEVNKVLFLRYIIT